MNRKINEFVAENPIHYRAIQHNETAVIISANINKIISANSPGCAMATMNYLCEKSSRSTSAVYKAVRLLAVEKVLNCHIISSGVIFSTKPIDPKKNRYSIILLGSGEI